MVSITVSTRLTGAIGGGVPRAQPGASSAVAIASVANGLRALVIP